MLRHLDAIPRGNAIVEFRNLAAVSAPDDPVELSWCRKGDLRPTGSARIADPAVLVPETAVVQVIDPMDIEAGQEAGSGRYRPRRSEGEVCLALRAVNLQLVETGFRS